jgi:predicted ATP-grasp superfamily ATP-dependent carboligase
VTVLTLERQRRRREASAFRERVRAADWSLIVAPEFDDLLHERCRRVEDEGGRLLGPSSEGVGVAGDKWLTGQRLCACGVPTPRTWLASRNGWPLLPAYVRKPRWGAGSQGVLLVLPQLSLDRLKPEAQAKEGPCSPSLALQASKTAAGRSEVKVVGHVSTASFDSSEGDQLIQEYVPGLPASVALLIGPSRVMSLPAAWQRLSRDGHFIYRGGRIPLAPPLARRAQALAERAVRAVPGLRGYVGVDLVLGAAADGSGDAVIEINPRLTTSYVGLRELAATSLAEAMLHVAAGEDPGDLKWRRGVVTFTAEGRVNRRARRRL